MGRDLSANTKAEMEGKEKEENKQHRAGDNTTAGRDRYRQKKKTHVQFVLAGTAAAGCEPKEAAAATEKRLSEARAAAEPLTQRKGQRTGAAG
jgi:hypothetical protein